MFSLIKHAEFVKLEEGVKVKRLVNRVVDFVENVNKNHVLYDVLLTENQFVKYFPLNEQDEIEFEPQPEFRGRKIINLDDREEKQEKEKIQSGSFEDEDENRRRGRKVVVLVKHRGRWIPAIAKKSRYFDKMYLINDKENFKKEVMKDQIVSVSEIPDKKERDFIERVIERLADRKIVVYGVYDPSVSIAKRYGSAL